MTSEVHHCLQASGKGEAVFLLLPKIFREIRSWYRLKYPKKHFYKQKILVENNLIYVGYFLEMLLRKYRC